jgi:signal transduction histidine kinase/DNA-binding response OmpR family regulator
MRLPHLRVALPWLIGLSLLASLACLTLALYLGFVARTGATDRAAQRMAAQGDGLARQIDSDMAQYDLVLREAARLAPGTASPNMTLLDLPLTAQYIGFINVLNEVGDVVADPRSNVSRPVNFAGRDYFQDHQKNPADIVMIGRPFATAPTQHASIPISRRLNRPDGGFAGVVVAGVRLTWLSDLLSHASLAPQPTVTIRRDDGLILMRSPYDPDAIGRTGAADPAWQNYLRTGLSETADDPAGIHLFRRPGTPPLVLELVLNRADIADGERSWLIWLPILALIPGICILGLGLAAHRLQRRAIRTETAANVTSDECMRLLANMSHELRTPLTGILGQAELLTDEGGLNNRQTTRMSRLTEAGTLMRQIVDRVINIARPDDVLEPPVLTPCDIDPLIRTCLGVVEGEARGKGVLLTSTIDPSAPRRAMLERDRVQQMVINLLMNAVKYTAKGSVALRVSGDTSRLRFEVSDTGPGIPPGKRSRLFRAYDRLDASPSGAEGSGLGLSITQGFARRMGGKVGHAENRGGGSVFWIELPITVPAESPDAAVSLDAAVPVPPPSPPVEIHHLCILLADDLDLTRAVTADFLRSAGHLVTEVADGEAAISQVQDHDFDVVLTDMRMPVVDGLEVTRRIRALPGHRGHTPVVLVTADLVALVAGASGHAGIDGCVRKPFTRAELLTAVLTAARLTPVPDDDQEALNPATLTDLKRNLGDAALATHLGTAARRIGDLLGLLERPDALANPAVRDAVHDLIGVAGYWA